MAADVIVVVNPSATRFSVPDVRNALESAANEHGLRLKWLELPAEGAGQKRLAQSIQDGIRDGASRVVAVGGDGTIGFAAGALTGLPPRSQATLALIPAGTANVFARELGLTGTLPELAAVALGSDDVLTVDAIGVAGRTVLTQVGVGPDAFMIQDTSRERQVRLGRLAYILAFLRRAFDHRPRRYVLEVDGALLRARAWQIVIANAGSLGTPPFTWGPGIDPSDGALDLCIYDVRTPGDYLRLFWRVVLGRHRRDRNTRFLAVRHEAVIRSRRPLPVQGDGEIIGRTPIEVRVLPATVRVVVKQPVPGAGITSSLPRGAGNEADRAESRQAAEPSPVARDMRQMLAERSRTWPLQGALRHPGAALEALDAALFLRVNGLLLGTFLDGLMTGVSKVMTYGEAWGVVVLAMVAVDFRSGMTAAVQELPALGLAILTINLVIKKVFRRRRPFLSYVKARVLGPRPTDYSFPSGHSAAAFAGAYLLGAHAPALAPLYYAFASLVGLSRVYLGVHYPSDVAVGAAGGIVLAAAYRALFHAIAPIGG